MIIDILEKSKAEKKFIRVWLYGNDEEFWSDMLKTTQMNLSFFNTIQNRASLMDLLLRK